MILIDTTVWIDFFRGTDSPEKRTLEHLLQKGTMVAITDIILTEILRGIPHDKEYQMVKRQLNSFPCLTAKAPRTFVHAADLYRRCRKKGVTIRSTVDCLIAAVCLEHETALLHHDSDFTQLAKHTGLKIAKVDAA